MSGLYLHAGVILDSDTYFRVSTKAGTIPAIHIGGPGLGGHLSIQTDPGAAGEQAAGRLLAAVTDWHAEIHRRGHGNPVAR